MQLKNNTHTTLTATTAAAAWCSGYRRWLHQRS